MWRVVCGLIAYCGALTTVYSIILIQESIPVPNTRYTLEFMCWILPISAHQYLQLSKHAIASMVVITIASVFLLIGGQNDRRKLRERTKIEKERENVHALSRLGSPVVETSTVPVMLSPDLQECITMLSDFTVKGGSYS